MIEGRSPRAEHCRKQLEENTDYIKREKEKADAETARRLDRIRRGKFAGGQK